VRLHGDLLPRVEAGVCDRGGGAVNPLDGAKLAATEGGATMRELQSRAPEELTVPALSTPGIDRREAFADEHVWVGTIRTEPNTWSDWHVHRGHDTYGYVTAGIVRVEFDGDGNGVEAAPGGFVLIPAGIPHREGNPGDVANAGVIFRVGEGPVLEPLDGPPTSG
jgi:uncharacterized RmlC-like cupin family protein